MVTEFPQSGIFPPGGMYGGMGGGGGGGSFRNDPGKPGHPLK